LCASIALGLLLAAAVISRPLLDQPFPGFVLWENGVLVQLHSPTWSGPRAGLPLQGGRIVSVDGRPFAGGAALLAQTASLPAGTPVVYGVREHGETHNYSVATMQLSWRGYLTTFGSYLATGIFFFLIALTALHLRPDHRASRALAMLAASIASVCVLAVQYLASCRFVALPLAAEAALPIAALHFALVFPVERLTRRTRVRALAGLASFHGLLLALTLLLFDGAPEWAARLALIPNATTSLIAIAVVAGLAQTFVSARSPNARLQAGIVLAGASAAFLLPAVALLASIMLGWPISFSGIVAPLSIFPLSVLYAVVRHNLLGAERFIRLAVGYTFATSAVVLGYATVVWTLNRSISSAASMEPASGFALLIAMAISFEPLRQRIQIALDRSFFQSKVDPERVLKESSYELATLSDVNEISQRLANRLRQALTLEWAEVGVPDPSRKDAQIVEPIRFREEVLGSLACGPKQSAAPFSSRERDLIRSLAGQAAVALRNAHSIRELAEAQAEMLRTEHLTAIGEFAGAVIHGIRGPLAGIRAASQIAHEQTREPQIADTLQSVLSEADRLDERIRTLLEFSRRPEPEPASRLDLRNVVRALRDALAARAQSQAVEIVIETPSELPQVHARATSLEHCLLELAENALAAMPEGGRLRIEVGVVESGPRVFTRVSDTGNGIAPGVQARVFELFYTTRAGHSGMGLATVKKNLQQMGGSIELETSGPGGTCFRVELPRLEPA
jgi:signal transduction histidine kinase